MVSIVWSFCAQQYLETQSEIQKYCELWNLFFFFFLRQWVNFDISLEVATLPTSNEAVTFPSSKPRIVN